MSLINYSLCQRLNKTKLRLKINFTLNSCSNILLCLLDLHLDLVWSSNEMDLNNVLVSTLFLFNVSPA